MAGVCVEKLSHSCGSVDGLQVYEDEGKYTGFCWRCGTYIADPYKDGTKPNKTFIKKTQEEIDEEIWSINNNYPILDLPTRKLNKSTLEYFDVKIGVDESDGSTPRFVFFPYQNEQGSLLSYKVRILDPKKMWFLGSGKRMPFGWFKAIETGARKLFIVEGEFDVLALYQILKDANRGTPYEKYHPAVISFPTGSNGVLKEFTKFSPMIHSIFKEIIFVPDQDEPGLEAADKLVKAYPSIKIATLPCKDANACILEGKKKAAHKAVLFQASKPKNSRLIFGSALIEAAKEKPKWGLSWPWRGMTDTTRGIRRGETIYVGAGVKMGKSELVSALAAHIILEHNLPVLLAKPEEPSVKSFQRLVGKAAHRIFHDPKIEFDEEAYNKYAPLIGDKAIILGVYQHLKWEHLKEDIRYATQNEGVKDVFIDPITSLTNQMGSSDANEFLVAMTSDLSAMALDLDFTAYIFCHLKAPLTGLPHEFGGTVESRQFAGSRAMMRACNYMIGLEGNKHPDLSTEEKNIRDLVILEDREFGNTERIKLYWDYRTGSFVEIEK